MSCHNFRIFKEGWRLVLLTAVLLQASLLAQDDAPKPPYLAEKAPASSRWTIDYSYAGGEGARPTAPILQQKRIQKSEVTKSGNVKLERAMFDGGGIQDVWTSGGLKVLRDPAYAHKIVRRQATGGDFPELQWINEAEFKGRDRVGDKDCLVFQKELYALQFADPGLFAAEMAQEIRTLDLGEPLAVEAWIDAKSRLPVRLSIGGDLRTYTFTPPPSAPLVIPPDYAAAIAGVEEKFRAFVKPLAKP